MKEFTNIQLIIPQVIFGDPELSSNAKWILTEIYNLFKLERRWCWASNGHFAGMFSLNKDNISLYVKELEKQGWITSERVKTCSLEECQLKEKGLHRHIFPAKRLSKILDALVITPLPYKRKYPTVKKGVAYRNGQAQLPSEIYIENNNEIKKNSFKTKKTNGVPELPLSEYSQRIDEKKKEIMQKLRMSI